MSICVFALASRGLCLGVGIFIALFGVPIKVMVQATHCFIVAYSGIIPNQQGFSIVHNDSLIRCKVST